MKIQLTKISPSDSPEFPTSTNKDLQSDELAATNESPWVGYSVVGDCYFLPEIGRCFQFVRTERNNEKIIGVFRTSMIKNIKVGKGYFILETRNSKYELRSLQE